MVSVKIGNEGTLALRYQLDVVVNGDIGDLADVIDVYYVKDAHARTSLPTDMSEMGSPIGTLRQVLEGSADLGVARGNLIAGEADFATIALKMKESAGNDYQGESIGATFDIMLNATQLTHETDGFGSDQYDATAQYPVSVSDSDSFESAIESGKNSPVEINLTESIFNRNTLNITGDITLNMGKNLLKGNEYTEAVGRNVTVSEGGSLIINAEAKSGLAYNAGRLTADGKGSMVTVNGGKYGDSGANNSEISALNGGTVRINDGSFSTSGAGGHAVMAGSDSVIYIDGGSFSCSGANSIAVYADGGTIIINDFSFSAVNGKKYGVDNGGQILVSKSCSADKPTGLSSGCTVTDNGDGYWLIKEN